MGGSAMTKREASQLKLPNPAPFVCSILVGPNSDALTLPELTPSVVVSDDFVTTATAIYGHDYCSADESVGEMQSVKNPELLLLRTEELTNIHVVFGNFMFSSFSASIAVFLLMAVTILIFMIAVFVRNLESDEKIECNQKRKSPYGTIWEGNDWSIFV